MLICVYFNGNNVCCVTGYVPFTTIIVLKPFGTQFYVYLRFGLFDIWKYFESLVNCLCVYIIIIITLHNRTLAERRDIWSYGMRSDRPVCFQVTCRIAKFFFHANTVFTIRRIETTNNPKSSFGITVPRWCC